MPWPLSTTSNINTGTLTRSLLDTARAEVGLAHSPSNSCKQHKARAGMPTGGDEAIAECCGHPTPGVGGSVGWSEAKRHFVYLKSASNFRPL